MARANTALAVTKSLVESLSDWTADQYGFGLLRSSALRVVARCAVTHPVVDNVGFANRAEGEFERTRKHLMRRDFCSGDPLLESLGVDAEKHGQPLCADAVYGPLKYSGGGGTGFFHGRENACLEREK